MVLEDGPEICSAESSAESSDHGEELTGMSTAEMSDGEGNPALERAHLT
jgi:hypothetical protein